MGIRQLRDRYLTADPDLTRLRVFDLRLWLSERDDDFIRSKARRLTWSARCLGGSVILMLASSIVEYIR